MTKQFSQNKIVWKTRKVAFIFSVVSVSPVHKKCSSFEIEFRAVIKPSAALPCGVCICIRKVHKREWDLLGACIITSTVSLNSSSSPSVSGGKGLALWLVAGLVSRLLVIYRDVLRTLCGEVSLEPEIVQDKFLDRPNCILTPVLEHFNCQPRGSNFNSFNSLKFISLFSTFFIEFCFLFFYQ